MHYQNERNYGCRVSDDWEFRGNKVAIIENEMYFIDVIGLKEHLSMTRSNGLVSMIKQMKFYALAFQAK